MTSQPTPTEPPPVNGVRAYVVAFGIAASQLVVMGGYAAFSVFVKPLTHDVGFGSPSQTTVSFAATIVMFLMLPLGMAAGVLCDRFGARPIILVTGVSLGAAFLLAPEARTVAEFLAMFSFLMGVSTSFMSAPGPATIGSWFSEEQMALGIGIGEAGVAIGSALLPLVAGLLLSHFGEDNWRPAMRWMAAFAVIPTLASTFTAARAMDTETEGHDDGGTEGHNGVLNKQRVVSSASDDSPLDEPLASSACNGGPPSESLITLIKTSDFLVLFLAQTCFGFAYFGFLFIGMPFAQIMGEAGTAYSAASKISVAHASALFTFYGVTSAIGALALGGAAAFVNASVVLSVSNIGAAAGFVACIFAARYAELAAIYAWLGLCFAGSLTCIPSLVVRRFAGPHLNAVMAASFVGFSIGGMSGPPVFSALQAATGSRRSYEWAFVVGAVMLSSVAAGQLLDRVCRDTSAVDDGPDRSGRLIQDE